MYRTNKRCFQGVYTLQHRTKKGGIDEAKCSTSKQIHTANVTELGRVKKGWALRKKKIYESEQQQVFSIEILTCWGFAVLKLTLGICLVLCVTVCSIQRQNWPLLTRKEDARAVRSHLQPPAEGIGCIYDKVSLSLVVVQLQSSAFEGCKQNNSWCCGNDDAVLLYS